MEQECRDGREQDSVWQFLLASFEPQKLLSCCKQIERGRERRRYCENLIGRKSCHADCRTPLIIFLP
jgi:hypothetical protein